MQSAWNRESSVPAFIQIEQDIRRKLLSGHFKNGERLPRETVLAEQYGASRVTIRRALEELAAANLVIRRHGIGTIATPPADVISCDLDVMLSFAEQLVRAGMQPETTFDRRRIVDDLPEEFDGWMDLIAPPYVFVSRTVKVSGRSLALNRSWLPASRFPELESKPIIKASLWHTITENYAVVPCGSRNRVDIVTASSEEARRLICEPGSPLMRLQGAVFDEDRQAIELSSVLWAGQVRLNFGAHNTWRELSRT